MTELNMAQTSQSTTQEGVGRDILKAVTVKTAKTHKDFFLFLSLIVSLIWLWYATSLSGADHKRLKGILNLIEKNLFSLIKLISNGVL